MNPQEAVQQAHALSSDVPDGLREAAFTELLKHFLGSAPGAGTHGGRELEESTEVSTGPTWLSELAEKLPERHLVAEGTRNQQLAWAVTQLALRDEEATTETVRRIIREELGVSPPDTSNASRKLGQQLTPKYLHRKKRQEGRGYAYSPTRKVAELFTDDS